MEFSVIVGSKAVNSYPLTCSPSFVMLFEASRVNVNQYGVIGTLGSAVCERGMVRWRTEAISLPLMMNQSIHHFDGIRWILNDDPEWCFARSFNPDWNDCNGPTVLETIYGFSNDVVVTYSGSYVAQGKNTPYSGLWRIEGSTGQLQFVGDSDDAPVVLSRRELEEQRELPLLRSELDGPARVCKEFLMSLTEGIRAPTDSTDNIKSLCMGWAAEISSTENRVVKMAELL